MNRLTPTTNQVRIIELHDKGLTPAQIAAELHLAESSIKAQITRVQKKVKAGWQPAPTPIELAAGGNE